MTCTEQLCTCERIRGLQSQQLQQQSLQLAAQLLVVSRRRHWLVRCDDGPLQLSQHFLKITVTEIKRRIRLLKNMTSWVSGLWGRATWWVDPWWCYARNKEFSGESHKDGNIGIGLDHSPGLPCSLLPLWRPTHCWSSETAGLQHCGHSSTHRHHTHAPYMWCTKLFPKLNQETKSHTMFSPTCTVP